MFQKIDVYVVLLLTNIIIGQLNTKLYDSDNGIPKFFICENLETHFHLVLFEHWHENNNVHHCPGLEFQYNQLSLRTKLSKYANMQRSVEKYEQVNFCIL